jgi:hypothetical protein
LPCSSGINCAGGATTNTAVCPAGIYCPGGGAAPVPCPAGTYSSATSQAAATTCIACSAGILCAGGATSNAVTCPAGQ